MKMRLYPLVSPLCFVVVLACTTTGGAQRIQSDRVVMIDGQAVLVEDAAKDLLQRARRARAAGELAEARTLLAELQSAYPDASVVDAAKIAQAQLLLDEKQPEEAQRLMEALLLENPTSAEADEARYVLALSQLAQGDTSAATPALEQMVEQMPTADGKREASRKLAAELENQGQAAEAVRYLARSLAMATDDAEREAIQERIVSLIDTQIDFVSVRKLREFEAEKGSFLDEVLLFKLARIHLHLRDYLAASEAAKEYITLYPAGRFHTKATELVASLAARVEVEPSSIGVILPLTGTYKSYGHRVLTAIKLGMGLPVDRTQYQSTKKVEKVLSVEKKGLKLLVRDSQGDPARAAQLVQELVEENRVVAILGDILLDTALPVALKAEEFGVPVISLSRREGITELGPWSFRISFTAQKQARALAKLAMEHMGLSRFAILYPRHAYGVELMNAFWDEVETRKGEVTAIESYGHDQTTFTTEAKSLVGRLHLEARNEYAECRNQAKDVDNDYRRKKALERCRDSVSPIVDFDALLIPDDYRTVSYVVPALAAEDILVTNDKRTLEAYRKTTENERVRPVQLLGGAMWNHPELGERLGRQIEGALLVDGFSTRDGNKKVSQFMENFVEVHRSSPAVMEAHAFDAGHLLMAILAGQSGAPPKNRDEMRNTLSKVKSFPGVTGLVEFDEQGDSATAPRFFTFERGSIVDADLKALKAQGDG